MTIYNGDGYGYGDGDGNGNGDGDGYGYGYGNGNGNGYGDGYGDGNGNGNGNGYGGGGRNMAELEGYVIVIGKDGWVDVGRVMTPYSSPNEMIVLDPAANVRRWNGSDSDRGIGALQDGAEGHKLDYYRSALQILGSDVKRIFAVANEASWKAYFASQKT
jgi:hypothetical protein